MAKLLGQSSSNTNNEIQNKDLYSVWTDNKADPHNYESFRERTQRDQAQMRSAAPLMFSKFMRCSKRTCTTYQQERSIDSMDITYSVRLIQMGLIEATVKLPVIAFSIQLLRLHHLIWRLCRVRINPFYLAIDEYLDAQNPIITLAHGVQVTQKKSLKLTSLQQLAANCPCCFGPWVEGKREAKPDFIVCMDGNFQHCRHKAASSVV
ncbi:hypothetical protein DFH28DRAFT_1085190 [Melampsora americana]|nr:hypothetical protein DFH28DRAFT_1085190 [Melampsora americana]